MEYKQILRGYYDTEKKVKAIDLLTDQPYFIEDRPDMKQRIERAINFKQLLAVYQRGTRNGFKYIEQDNFYIFMIFFHLIQELEKVSFLINKFEEFLDRCSEYLFEIIF